MQIHVNILLYQAKLDMSLQVIDTEMSSEEWTQECECNKMTNTDKKDKFPSWFSLHLDFKW